MIQINLNKYSDYLHFHSFSRRLLEYHLVLDDLKANVEKIIIILLLNDTSISFVKIKYIDLVPTINHPV